MTTRFLQCALLALATLFFVSCKKESTTSSTDYYVKLKKDGTWLTFTGANTAGELGPDGFDPANLDLGVSAQSADGKNRFDLTVQIVGTTFPTGTYHSSYLVDHPYINISYIYTPTATSMEYYEIEPSSSMAEPSAYTVNVTEITSTTLRGTLTGNYLTESTSGTTTAITEGEFYVKRIR